MPADCPRATRSPMIASTSIGRPFSRSRYIEEVKGDPLAVSCFRAVARNSSDVDGPDNCNNFLDERQGKGGPAGGCLDFAYRATHQAGDGAKRGDQNPFPPHFAANDRGQPCVEAGALHEKIVQSLNPLRNNSIQLPIGKILQRGELYDAPVIVETRRNLESAADDVLRREARRGSSYPVRPPARDRLAPPPAESLSP
jgi:hypothetical protein